MDRDLIFIVAFGIMGLALFGGMFLGDGDKNAPASAAAVERPLYAKDDIRYKYQQEEAKANRNKPKTAAAAPPKDQFVTDGSTSARKDEGSGSDKNNDNDNDEDNPAEEPPLD